jgi:DNA-binding NtrC family response regulator
MYLIAADNIELACAAVLMADSLSAARQSAADGGAVLIVGERGTGKETIGRYVHENGRRSGGPFVPVDCAALLDPTMAAEELFGRSAAPGRARESVGLIRSAHGGTLYLDEIAALHPVVQHQLLLALRAGQIERLGDGRAFPIDLQVIASTTTDIATALARGAIVAALHRLWQSRLVRVPPLRDRSVDVPALARCLLRARADAVGEGPQSLTGPAADALRSYAWPGNLPELAHSLDAAAARSGGGQIDVDHLPGQIRGTVATPRAESVRFMN